MQTLKKAIFTLIAAPLALTAASAAMAQEHVFVRPEPTSLEGRFQPAFGAEALVRARYTVKADGTVTDVELIDYHSNQFLNNMLKDNISKWTFRPGTVDGQPDDFHNQEWLFAVRIDPNMPPMPPPRAASGRGARIAPPAPSGPGGPGGPGAAPGAGMPPIDFSQMPTPPLALSTKMKEGMDAVSELILKNDLDKALKEVTKLGRSDIRTVFDYALVREMEASILTGQNQHFEALEASKLATMYGYTPQGEKTYFLPDEALQSALRREFLLAARLNHNKVAVETYQTLEDHFGVGEDDPLSEFARTLQAQMDSPDPLPMLAKIIDKQWSYKPARRIFTVTDVKGKLDKINARCERRNLELKFQDGVDWTLPEALGNCELDFMGRKGTTFTVYEFAE
jgi:hypothetical protein